MIELELSQFFGMMFQTSAELFTLIFIITSLVAVIRKDVFIGSPTESLAKVASVLYAVSCLSSLSYFLLEHIGVSILKIPFLCDSLVLFTSGAFLLGIVATLKAGFTLLKKLRR